MSHFRHVSSGREVSPTRNRSGVLLSEWLSLRTAMCWRTHFAAWFCKTKGIVSDQHKRPFDALEKDPEAAFLCSLSGWSG
jgi:hypothetical protein